MYIVEISVVLCDNQYIRDLNGQYLGKNEATDVLSFPMDSEEDNLSEKSLNIEDFNFSDD